MKKIKTLKNSKTQELHYFRVNALKHDLAIIQPFLNWKTDTIAIFSDFKKPFSFKKYFVTDILYKGYQIDNKKSDYFIMYNYEKLKIYGYVLDNENENFYIPFKAKVSLELWLDKNANNVKNPENYKHIIKINKLKMFKKITKEEYSKIDKKQSDFSKFEDSFIEKNIKNSYVLYYYNKLINYFTNKNAPLVSKIEKLIVEHINNLSNEYNKCDRKEYLKFYNYILYKLRITGKIYFYHNQYIINK